MIVAAQAKYLNLVQTKNDLISSLHSSTCVLTFPVFLRVTSAGQQEDKEDAGGGAASEERAGEDRQESPEEHERPNLGRD